MRAAALGLCYVRTVTAACLAADGHDVWGVDVDAAKIAEIRAGRSPVVEPLDGAGAAIVSTSDAAAPEALLASPPPHLIDLSGRLGSQVESLPGYEGLGW